jgi:hypothetical protein
MVASAVVFKQLPKENSRPVHRRKFSRSGHPGQKRKTKRKIEDEINAARKKKIRRRKKTQKLFFHSRKVCSHLLQLLLQRTTPVVSRLLETFQKIVSVLEKKLKNRFLGKFIYCVTSSQSNNFIIISFFSAAAGADRADSVQLRVLVPRRKRAARAFGPSRAATKKSIT